MLGLSDEALATFRSRGYEVLHEVDTDSLNGAVTRMALPPGIDVSSALEEAAQVAPQATATPNHIYRPQAATCEGACAALKRVDWPPISASCTASMVVGVVDTGADMNHPSLRGAQVVVRRVHDGASAPSGLDHGTAVVSLLVGNGAGGIRGLIPGARVLLADAFHATNDGDVADTLDIVAGIDWLLSTGVPVIQLSLSGPDNAILKRLITAARLRGSLLIAAAGNVRGTASAAFPAAYPGVVGVAAASLQLRAYRHGTRGEHVDLSAPGVNLQVAAPGVGQTIVSGTSFATPFVAAAHALALHQGLPRDRIFDLFSQTARDLGAPGRDPVFGWGMLQIPKSIGCD